MLQGITKKGGGGGCVGNEGRESAVYGRLWSNLDLIVGEDVECVHRVWVGTDSLAQSMYGSAL